MMAAEVEECITHQSDSLPSGSISFGRFDLESLSWERRSTFSHNRYLEEVEKYSTPGSVTKKKEYFEAHFRKKALLHQVSVENERETETKCIAVDNDSILEDFVRHDDDVYQDGRDVPAVSDEHEANELDKEEMLLAELSTRFPSFNNVKCTVEDNGVLLDEGCLFEILEDKALDANENDAKLDENWDAPSTIPKTKKKNESSQMKSRKVSTKISDTVEQKAGKSQCRTHLPTQQMPKKPSRNGNSVSNGKLKKAENQNTVAKLQKRIPSKVFSSSTYTENGNFKATAYRNLKAKATSEIKSEEAVRAKKAEVVPHPVERRGNDVCQPVNRVKSISKAEDKPTSSIFKFKSSERAEKRKEYFLKLEEKLHAKEAEMNEIQARTKEVKEAEMKQLRKSLIFKATPMPSFYHETAPKAYEGKKMPTIQTKSPITHIKCSTSNEKSLPSPPSNEQNPSHREPHGSTRPMPTNRSTKKADGLKGDEKGKLNSSHNQGNNGIMRKKWESKGRMGHGVVGKVKGNVAVHVAS